ncbi:thiol:disulfide interchange protein DsbG [Acidithiobacillus sp. HP-6]|uniref:thiol:disulfide interchange protein DsbG n=1 Tax=unclassified Acidithiobacillus TaxID=2614800 RepID=UPI0018798168|nr:MULTISPECIES: thiol:disulfide interchange protein DsbG [unclassified Acidithiobacillus]MBE7562203.1 thiol:disulfide interchange protein DsbG [Acidithiobacillus sp. HP-6]MBE7568928.1 thiol:disulfide interchange protein DsbG [Acidithiobacillus sp. HP-2]
MRLGPARSLVGGLAAGLLLTSSAWAMAGTIPHSYQAGAKTIVAMSHGQAKILRTFRAKAGLNGYTVQLSPGHALVMYTSPNGKYVFMGGVFDKAGHNLSVAYAHQYLPKTDLPQKISPSAMGKAVEKTTNFLIGSPKATKQIWFVGDPNCIFCHMTYEHLLPYVDKGELKIHLIPVGFLKPSSAPKAETIIASKNPAKAWAYDEAHFNVPEEEGGIVPLAKIPANDQKDIQANTAWMSHHGINGTPFLVYQNAQGHWAVNPGMPEDTKAFVQGIGG